jgi:Ser/Thr protein kinase RdoA (MazF antagonist)
MFIRRRWDWDGLFGDESGFYLPAHDLWNLLPSPVRSLAESVALSFREAMKRQGYGSDTFGLIHADLHLGNVLFRGGHAVPIDFDDCGYAHYLYDLAVPIADNLDHDDWQSLKDALYEGYQTVRPLPRGTEDMKVFVAGRLIALLLWATDMAQVNERFARRLDEWTSWTVDSVKTAGVAVP